MAFQSVPNTASITVIHSQNGENLVNTMHAELVTGYDQADIQALATAVDLIWGTEMKSLMTQNSAYTRTEVRGLAIENDLFAFGGNSAGPGGVASGGLPNSVTLSIKKNSGFTGRSARGRLYVIGMPAATLSSDENVYLSASVNAREDALELVRAAIAATDWTPVIVSRFANGVPRDFGVTFPWVSVTAIDNTVDTQRERIG